MLNRLLFRLGVRKQQVTEKDLKDFAEIVKHHSDAVVEQNLAVVPDIANSSSGENYSKLVRSAGYFVTECCWMFNSKYAKEYTAANYWAELTHYIEEVREDFDNHYHDTDGVGAGTITDILNRLKPYFVEGT